MATFDPTKHPNLPQGPERKNFATEEEYEEAKGFWGSRIGRLQKMAGVTRTQASEDSSAKPEDGETPNALGSDT